MYCGCSHTRRLCAYPACYIFSWWRRPRPPRGLPLGRLIYRRRFILLFARFYASILGWLSLSLLLFFHMLIPVASRSSSRHAVSLCVSFLCVPLCHVVRLVVRRLVPSARLGLPSRMGVVSPCCSLVLVSHGRGGLVLRSHAVSFCLGISSRPCVPSLRPVCRLVDSSRPLPSSRSVSPVGVSDPFSCLVPVFAPFCPALRSFLTHFVRRSRFMSSVVGRGCVVMAMGRGWLALLVSSVRSLRGGSVGGCGHWAPFRVARRSSLVRSCPIALLLPPALSLPCVPILLIHEARQRGDGWRRRMAKGKRGKRDA